MKTRPTAKAEFLVNFMAASVGTADGTPIDRSTDIVCSIANASRRSRRATLYTTNCLSSVSLSE